MKGIWIVIVSMILCVGLVSGQSLVDLAKKEKKRREENAKEGRQAKELSLDEGSDDSSSDEPVDSVPEPNASTAGEPQGSNSDDWDRIFADYQLRYDDAKNRLADLERSLKQCEQQLREEREDAKKRAMKAGKSWLTDPNYRVSGSCESYTKRIEQAKNEMRAIDAACADDARKRRILPGRARLRE